MRYAGVIVVYNPNESTIKNIDSYICGIEKLYVVDNSEGVDNFKKFKDKKIEYINNGANLGIAEALNIGAQKAIKDGFDWLLTMDQDSRFYKDHIYKLIKYIENNDVNKVGIVSPFHSILQTRGMNYTGTSEPLLVMTSGNMVNLKAYSEVSGYKSWFFIDCVDFDFCLNLRKHNYEIIQLNTARLKHNLGSTIEKHLLGKTMYVSNHSPVRRYYMVRNRHYIYDLFADTFPEYCRLELSRTKRELLKIWLFEKNKIKKSIYMYRGYKDYKKGVVGKYGENKTSKK